MDFKLVGHGRLKSIASYHGWPTRKICELQFIVFRVNVYKRSLIVELAGHNLIYRLPKHRMNNNRNQN